MEKQSPPHLFSMDDLYMAIDETAKRIASHKSIVIVGSQAMLASIPPEKWDKARGIQESHDIDLFCMPEMEISDRQEIIQATGEDSEFRKENGWNLEPVGDWVMMTSLPGWIDRLLQVNTPKGNKGYCLHPLDIVFNKAEAGREKDVTYILETIKLGIVKPSQIAKAIQENELTPGTADRVNKTMQTVVSTLLQNQKQTPEKSIPGAQIS